MVYIVVIIVFFIMLEFFPIFTLFFLGIIFLLAFFSQVSSGPYYRDQDAYEAAMEEKYAAMQEEHDFMLDVYGSYDMDDDDFD